MHPILRSRARLGGYLLGWLPIALLLVNLGMNQGWSPLEAGALALPLCAAGAALFLSSWYICRAFPLERLRPSAAWPAWILAAALMGVLWAALGILLGQALALIPGLGRLGARSQSGAAVFAALGCILYLATLALHYLLLAQERSQASERAEVELRVLAREAELKALRAQINPHFLFNSLNSISALTTLDSARAREMCVLLADFLRRSLKLGEKRLVSLAEETDLLRSYLAIERIRFGERLQVVWELEPGSEAVLLPALLLQPLVENAIKHGIAALPEGGQLRLAARLLSTDLEIVVENPLDPDADTPKGLGLGLRQVQERIRGRYGADALFEAGVRDGVHRVRMAFPREPGRAAAAGE